MTTVDGSFRGVESTEGTDDSSVYHGTGRVKVGYTVSTGGEEEGVDRTFRRVGSKRDETGRDRDGTC